MLLKSAGINDGSKDHNYLRDKSEYLPTAKLKQDQSKTTALRIRISRLDDVVHTFSLQKKKRKTLTQENHFVFLK